MAIDLEKLAKHRNEHNPFAKKIGVVLDELQLGYAKVKKVIMEDDLNPINVPHGGVYFTMADIACGFAMASHGYMAVTLDASYHYMKSAKVGDTLTAIAQETRHGKTLGIYDVQVTDQNNNLLGSGTFTFYSLDTPITFDDDYS